jgi:hypothetical protein
MAEVVCRSGRLFGEAERALALTRDFGAIVLRGGKRISFCVDERLIYKEGR